MVLITEDSLRKLVANPPANELSAAFKRMPTLCAHISCAAESVTPAAFRKLGNISAVTIAAFLRATEKPPEIKLERIMELIHLILSPRGCLWVHSAFLQTEPHVWGLFCAFAQEATARGDWRRQELDICAVNYSVLLAALILATRPSLTLQEFQHMGATTESSTLANALVTDMAKCGVPGSNDRVNKSRLERGWVLDNETPLSL
jgi:hypothetical protein